MFNGQFLFLQSSSSTRRLLGANLPRYFPVIFILIFSFLHGRLFLFILFFTGFRLFIAFFLLSICSTDSLNSPLREFWTIIFHSGQTGWKIHPHTQLRRCSCLTCGSSASKDSFPSQGCLWPLSVHRQPRRPLALGRGETPYYRSHWVVIAMPLASDDRMHNIEVRLTVELPLLS